jgi:hypothetical protein
VIEPEIGSVADGFWPPPARIEPLARRLYPAILHIARLAGPHLVLRTIAVEDPSGNRNGYADPGEPCSLVLEIANEGLAPSPEATLRVTSSAPGLALGAPRGIVRGHGIELQVPPLPAQGACRLSDTPLPAWIATRAEPGVPLALAMRIEGKGLDSVELEGEIRPGTPRCLLAGDPGMKHGTWDLGQGWGPKWAHSGAVSVVATGTTGTATGAAPSFTDSPGGPYPPSTDRALTLSHPISLAGIEHAELRYREQFQVEPWEDRCLVEARVAGEDWEPLLVVPGGVENGYRERRLSLDRYAGEEALWLRFRLVTNATVERDGWTVDDIQVWGYGGAGVPTEITRRPLPTPPSIPGTPSTSAAE